jgi:hypothetical protein
MRAGCVLAALAVVAGTAELGVATADTPFAAGRSDPTPSSSIDAATVVATRAAADPRPKRRQVFDRRILVAYYGTANTGSLGVLGEHGPDKMTKRLRAAAAPFAHGDTRVQIVYELIASIADAGPGADGDYSHYVDKRDVRRYVRAAKRNHALLVLDLQPGRSDFLSQAKHFGWALRKPWVGLALDPEWRMGPHEVPARTIGHVGAAEVNKVSRYVARLTRNHHLPQKVFMLHQFRTDMIRHIGNIKDRSVLAMVQHVDGFGTRGQKLATYHHVVRAKQFHQGFKLFYDEDTHLFKPRQVLRIRPRVQFVSYQ